MQVCTTNKTKYSAGSRINQYLFVQRKNYLLLGKKLKMTFVFQRFGFLKI